MAIREQNSPKCTRGNTLGFPSPNPITNVSQTTLLVPTPVGSFYKEPKDNQMNSEDHYQHTENAPIHREDYIGRGTVSKTASGQWVAKFYHPDAPQVKQKYYSVLGTRIYLAGLSHLYKTSGAS